MTLDEELLQAADLGKTLECQRLIVAGADVNCQTRNGSTPLNEACVQGHTPVVGLLLREGADPNITDVDLRTPLHRCSFHGWESCIDLLLKFGANPTLQDDRGRIPVEVASREVAKKKIEAFPKEETERLLGEWKEKNKERDRVVEQKRREKAEAAEIAATEYAQRQAAKEERAKRETEKTRQAAEAKRLREEERRRIEEEEANNLVSISGRGDIYVSGSQDKQLNGRYVEIVRHEHRVELQKIGCRKTHIFWASYTNEWRLTCANIKGGNTLFRNPQKEFLNDVPLEGWVKWFGNGDVPKFSKEPPSAEELEKDAQMEGYQVESPKFGAAPKSPKSIPSSPTRTPGVEYLEPHSLLDIVPHEDEPCVVSMQQCGVEEIEHKWILDGMEPVEATTEAIAQAKTEGNAYFTAGDTRKCIDRFSRAITAAQSIEVENGKDDNLRKTIGILHSNRSLALMKLDPPEYEMIVMDCNTALHEDPANFKALYRRAVALSTLGDYERAFQDITKVLDHYMKNNAGSNPQAVKLRDEIKENLRSERTMWRGSGRERTWNRAIPASKEEENQEMSFSLKASVKPRAKLQWTRADVEKHLESTKTGAAFWDNFCSLSIFQQAYAKVGMSVNAFAHLLKVLPEATFNEDTKKKYLEVALKTLSPTVLHMLSQDERLILEALDKRQLVEAQ